MAAGNDNGVLLIGLALLGGLALFGKEPAQSNGPYYCPYDNLPFDTLAELQDHVEAVHPGERIPIEITWS